MMREPRVYGVDSDDETRVKQRIQVFESILDKNKDTLTRRETLYYQRKLREELLLLEEIQENRKNFQFKHDVMDAITTVPIDSLLRDKIKDANYKGFIKKEKANEQIKKIETE